MGYGGNLLWSGVLKNIYLQDKKQILICYAPMISDIFARTLWDSSRSFQFDPIFINNPYLLFNKIKKKSQYTFYIDLFFMKVISFLRLRKVYEKFIFNRSAIFHSKFGYRIIHIDLRMHSYAKSSNHKKIIWKEGGHALDVIAKNFNVNIIDHTAELYFDQEEKEWLRQSINKNELNIKFIVIEPGSNDDWFGNLRAWPIDKWQELISSFIEKIPNYKIVQVGLKKTQLIDGALDLRSKTTFRQAAMLISKAALFIGTEGGLMHAARAVNAESLILWGGVTTPFFAGYPDKQYIIYKNVKCAPCGHLGWCDNKHKCMNDILVDEVFKRVLDIL